jgi:hypothetical protein
MHTDVNLHNYKYYPKTSSCYLDGRYFNKVFSKYPGLISKPLHITILHNNGRNEYTNQMKQSMINTQYPGLLRVIINTPGHRHSNLLILDYSDHKAYRYDPHGTSSPYYQEINQIIKKYLNIYFSFDVVDVDVPVNDIGNPICTSNGTKNGFCVAYVIKFAHDWLNQIQYKADDILRFAGAVEYLYGKLPEDKPDVEYGLFGSPNDGRLNPQGALIGGLGGAAIVGLLTGSGTEMLIGGLGGGLLGGMI